MSYRLIVCFDVEADNLEGAYRKLEGQLRHIPIAWETSDEAYDEEGEEIDPDVLQKAIVSALRTLDHDPATLDAWKTTALDLYDLIDEDTSSEVLSEIQHKMLEAERIKRSFTDGECPDCGDPIPDNMVDGGECANCGHVFTADANGRR